MAKELSDQARFPVCNPTDVESARQRGLITALALGFPQPEAFTIATVISELVHDISEHVERESVPTAHAD